MHLIVKTISNSSNPTWAGLSAQTASPSIVRLARREMSECVRHLLVNHNSSINWAAWGGVTATPVHMRRNVNPFAGFTKTQLQFL